MDRAWRMAGGLAGEMGGLLVFWVVLWGFGLRPAIAATLGFVVLDGARRLLRRTPVTRVWMLSNGLALAGGAIDLWATTPFMVRYEAIGTNLLTALLFLSGAFGRTSVVQEVAESWRGTPFEAGRPDLRAFFRAFTLVWAGYFLVKALVYLWIAAHLPLERALALRSMIGTASFALMILVSRRGAALFRLGRRCGLFALPAAAAIDPAHPTRV